MTRIRTTMDKRANGEKGFTLIELLVVVIIIGILAAIAVPAFLKQREKAWGSAVVSDLKNASLAAEAYATEHNGTYQGMDITNLSGVSGQGFNPTADVTVTVATASPFTSYTLTGKHAKLGAKTWTYSSTTGTVTVTP